MWREFGKPYDAQISLLEERRLIAKAKRGSRKCLNEIVLWHMGFVVFRLIDLCPAPPTARVV